MKYLFLSLLIHILFLSDLRSQGCNKDQRFEFSHSSMGSLFSIVCYGEDFQHAKRTAATAFNKLDSLNLLMSDYIPQSELQRVNRSAGSGAFVSVSTDLFEVVRESQKWSRKSNGDFDITVGALTQLWRRAGRKEILPASDDIKEAMNSVNYRFIKLDSNKNSILLEKPDMFLDLGGIAKGYAVDRIYQILIQNGYHRCLVDGGGDIRVGAPPPGRNGWEVNLAIDESDSLIVISDRAIATSGDLYRYVEIDGKRYSHLIDPKTGYGITVRRKVTILAGNCTDADVLASIVSIKGYPEAFNFLDRVSDNVQAIVQEKSENKVRVYYYPAVK